MQVWSHISRGMSLRHTEHFRELEIYLLILTHNLSHCAHKRVKYMYQLGIQKNKSSIVFMVVNKTCWVNLHHFNWTIIVFYSLEHCRYQ